MGVKATEMFFSNCGKSFLTMSLHDGQQDVTMNLCFSGTSSKKSAASSITHRSAPVATSYTSAKPRRWNALRIRSGTPSGPNCPTNAGRERHVHGGVAFDGLNGLEDLALVRDRTERAADHALAAGGALGVVDVGAAEPVGMDAVHAAGLAARALETHDGVELALFQAAPAADALIRVDVGLTVLPRDGLPRQTAMHGCSRQPWHTFVIFTTLSGQRLHANLMTLMSGFS